jgi:hypothetical protein
MAWRTQDTPRFPCPDPAGQTWPRWAYLSQEAGASKGRSQAWLGGRSAERYRQTPQSGSTGYKLLPAVTPAHHIRTPGLGPRRIHPRVGFYQQLWGVTWLIPSAESDDPAPSGSHSMQPAELPAEGAKDLLQGWGSDELRLTLGRSSLERSWS